MSDINQKRAYVSDLYSGQNWKTRVRRMSEEQVIAIYLRQLSKSKKDKPKPKKGGQDALF